MPVTRFITAAWAAIALLSGATAHAERAPASQVIHVADLPRWSGKPAALRWLTPSELRSSADGASPEVRYGMTRQPAVLHAYALTHLAPSGARAPLLAGRAIEPPTQTGCLQYELSLVHRPTGRRATWTVEKARGEGFFSRRLSCTGGHATG